VCLQKITKISAAQVFCHFFGLLFVSSQLRFLEDRSTKGYMRTEDNNMSSSGEQLVAI